MNVIVDASVDRHRILWVATSETVPEFVAEARTVEELRDQFAGALQRANLPRDTTLQVRFHYDHGTRAAATLALTMAANADLRAEENNP